MPHILFISALLTIGVYICGPIVDPDLWWHITVGRWILSHGQVPVTDHWNLFGQGQPWRAYSWSNEIIFAWFDKSWGAHGLIIVKLFVASIYSLVLGIGLGRISRSWFTGALLAIFTVAASFNHFTLRPQSIVWIFFVLVILFGEKISEEGLTRKNILALLIIFCAWANSHITTALGLLALITWTFDKKDPVTSIKATIIGFLGTCITPYLGGEWLTFFSKSGHPFEMRSIAEFQPATIMQYSTVFLVLGLAVFFLMLGRKPTRISPSRLVGLLIFSVAGLAIVKFLPLAVIYCSALIAILWRESTWDQDRSQFVEGVERLQKLIDWIPKEGLSFVMICFSIVTIVRLWQNPISQKIVPVAALDFIQNKALPPRILNDFGRGGYLMYRFSDSAGELSDQYKVPIDGRTNVNSHDTWEKHQAALFGKLNWHQYVELVNPETILWRNDSAFLALLMGSSDWCRVFKSGSDDDGFSVLVKKDWYDTSKAELISDNCGASKIDKSKAS